MEESIRISVSSGSLANSKFSSNTRNPEIEIMEKSLMIWIKDNVPKKTHKTVNSSMIRQKAVNM